MWVRDLDKISQGVAMRMIGVASTVLTLVLSFVFGQATTAQPRVAGSAGNRDLVGQGEAGRRLRDGQAIFRFDTFGDEQLWTDVLRMHDVIATVDPATALAVGLKVDVDALPPQVIAALEAGKVDLTDPAVTVTIMKLNAVV